MNIRLWSAASTVIALSLVLSLGPVARSPAAEAGEKAATKQEDAKKKGPLRVQDLPKPIPEVMETMKSVGNNVGNEIPKATSKVADAIKKAVKGNKDKEKD